MAASLVSVVLVVGLVLLLVLAARAPSGVRLNVEGDELVVRITGKDALFAVRSRLRLPLVSIKGVAVAHRHLVPQTGLRLPGTGVPGVLRAGSYGTGVRRDFWLVRNAEQLLVIELVPGGEYRRVVLEVPHPLEEALRLRPVVGAYTGFFTA